jgi:DNA-binding MarR family transcriptional regulator
METSTTSSRILVDAGSRILAEPLPILTEKQARCLSFIYDFFATNRDYPTHREIAEGLDIQSTNVQPYLEPLIKKGYLKRKDDSKRNIRLTKRALEKLELMEATAA